MRGKIVVMKRVTPTLYRRTSSGYRQLHWPSDIRWIHEDGACSAATMSNVGEHRHLEHLRATIWHELNRRRLVVRTVAAVADQRALGLGREWHAPHVIPLDLGRLDAKVSSPPSRGQSHTAGIGPRCTCSSPPRICIDRGREIPRARARARERQTEEEGRGRGFCVHFSRHVHECTPEYTRYRIQLYASYERGYLGTRTCTVGNMHAQRTRRRRRHVRA